MDIGEKRVVAFHYKLTNSDGETLDSSDGRDPLKYLHGARNIVPGLERALEGKSAGDSLQVTIAPEDAYGHVDPQLVHKVPLSSFEGAEEIKAGMQFQAQASNGEVHLITVKDVSGDEVTVDANHPLAGQTLNFDVEVKDVREATKEELEKGHAL